MLGIAAQLHQRAARPGEQQHVGPQRDIADRDDPPEQPCQRDAMQRPVRKGGPVARAHRARQVRERARRLVERPDHHPAEEAHHHLAQRAVDRRQGEPRLGRQVVRFGVAHRIGQMLIDVMLEMDAAVDAVGEPEIERRRRDQRVEPGPARRIAVDRFVLQRGLQADDRGAKGQHQPPGQIVIEPGDCGERAIDAGRQRQRRPVDPDLRDGARRIGRRRRPSVGDQLRQMQRDRIRLGLQPALVLDGLLGPVKHRASFRQPKKGAPAPWRSGRVSTVPPRPGPARPTTGGADRRRGTPGSDDGGSSGFWDPSPASGKSGVARRMLAAGRTNGERDHLGRVARRTRGPKRRKAASLRTRPFPRRSRSPSGGRAW